MAGTMTVSQWIAKQTAKLAGMAKFNKPPAGGLTASQIYGNLCAAQAANPKLIDMLGFSLISASGKPKEQGPDRLYNEAIQQYEEQ